MASCDDDFGLLADEAQSSQIHHHQHHHHQHQQQQQQLTAAVPFSHRYIAEAAAKGGGVSIHPRPLPPLNTITSPKRVGESEGYGEAFVNRHNCFAAADDDRGFAPQSQDEDDDGDDDGDDGDRRSHGDPAAATVAAAPSSRQRRKDRQDLSDGESPSLYYNSKKSRPTSSASAVDYRKDREEWSDSAIACLLDAYTEKYIQLNRGNLRGRDWEDVATIVSERCDKHKSGKSVEQCKNKVDNLKKRYKVECQRLVSGSLAVSHWPWFKKMEQIVGSSSSSSKAIVAADDDKCSAAVGGASTPTSRQIKRLYSFLSI